MKKLIAVLLLVVCLCAPAIAATVVTYPAPGVISIEPGAAPTDYDSTTVFSNGIRIKFIVAVVESSTVLKFRHGSVTGGFLPFIVLPSGGTAVLPFTGKQLIKPCLETDDQTWTGANTHIWILHE